MSFVVWDSMVFVFCWYGLGPWLEVVLVVAMVMALVGLILVLFVVVVVPEISRVVPGLVSLVLQRGSDMSSLSLSAICS